MLCKEVYPRPGYDALSGYWICELQQQIHIADELGMKLTDTGRIRSVEQIKLVDDISIERTHIIWTKFTLRGLRHPANWHLPRL